MAESQSGERKPEPKDEGKHRDESETEEVEHFPEEGEATGEESLSPNRGGRIPVTG